MAEEMIPAAIALAAGPAPEVVTLFVAPTFTATHLVIDPATHKAATIDSILDFDPPSGRTSPAIRRPTWPVSSATQRSSATRCSCPITAPPTRMSQAAMRECFTARSSVCSTCRRLHGCPCRDCKAPGRDQCVTETTIAAGRANIHVDDGVSKEEFVAMRDTRDRTLAVPRLILPSIRINIRAGHRPEPEASGKRYLKLPLNTL